MGGYMYKMLDGERVVLDLSIPWYALNRLYGVLYGCPKYTVSRLRRDRKGHPRCR